MELQPLSIPPDTPHVRSAEAKMLLDAKAIAYIERRLQREGAPLHAAWVKDVRYPSRLNPAFLPPASTLIVREIDSYKPSKHHECVSLLKRKITPDATDEKLMKLRDEYFVGVPRTGKTLADIRSKLAAATVVQDGEEHGIREFYSLNYHRNEYCWNGVRLRVDAITHIFGNPISIPPYLELSSDCDSREIDLQPILHWMNEFHFSMDQLCGLSKAGVIRHYCPGALPKTERGGRSEAKDHGRA